MIPTDALKLEKSAHELIVGSTDIFEFIKRFGQYIMNPDECPY